MRRALSTATIAGALTAGLLWAAPGLAADGAPIMTNMKATPKRFCAKRTSKCHHVGTLITFNLSKPAKVYLDVLPRFDPPRYGFMEVHRRFPAGPNSARISDSRMEAGPWDVRGQPTGASGAGPIDKIRVRVVKRD